MQVIVTGRKSFLSFLIQFSILHIAFSSLFYTHFGKSRLEYSSFIQTFLFLNAILLGGGSSIKPGVAAGTDEFARFWIIIFALVMTFVFTNIFISIICDMISAAADDISQSTAIEFDPIDYFNQKIKWLKKYATKVMTMTTKHLQRNRKERVNFPVKFNGRKFSINPWKTVSSKYYSGTEVKADAKPKGNEMLDNIKRRISIGIPKFNETSGDFDGIIG